MTKTKVNSSLAYRDGPSLPSIKALTVMPLPTLHAFEVLKYT